MKIASENSLKKHYVTLRQFKRLTRLCRTIIGNQDNIVQSIKAITSFRPTRLDGVDSSHEQVSRPDSSGRPGVSATTREKRSAKRKGKPDLGDIKGFFHNRGYTVQDDGKKPIKILNKKGNKVYTVQRKSMTIWKRDPNAERGYIQVTLEELV